MFNNSDYIVNATKANRSDRIEDAVAVEALVSQLFIFVKIKAQTKQHLHNF